MLRTSHRRNARFHGRPVPRQRSQLPGVPEQAETITIRHPYLVSICKALFLSQANTRSTFCRRVYNARRGKKALTTHINTANFLLPSWRTPDVVAMKTGLGGLLSVDLSLHSPRRQPRMSDDSVRAPDTSVTRNRGRLAAPERQRPRDYNIRRRVHQRVLKSTLANGHHTMFIAQQAQPNHPSKHGKPKDYKLRRRIRPTVAQTTLPGANKTLPISHATFKTPTSPVVHSNYLPNRSCPTGSGSVYDHNGCMSVHMHEYSALDHATDYGWLYEGNGRASAQMHGYTFESEDFHPEDFLELGGCLPFY